MKCKYWDCGFCYAPDDVVTSASSQGACFDYDFCPYLKTEMTRPTDADNDALFGKDLRVYSKKELETKKMDSVESIEAEIKMLQSKLSFLKELERTKSRKEIDYKRVYGEYPNYNNPSQWEMDSWDGFSRGYDMGYSAAQKDYKVKECQEPEKKKSLYQFLAEWKYGIEEGDIIPQFDNDEFSVLDWSQIFIEYLYECGDIISGDKDEIVIKLKQTQLEIPND